MVVSEEGVYSELHPVFVEQQARVEVVPGIHHQLEVEVEAEPTLDLPVALPVALLPEVVVSEEPEAVMATTPQPPACVRKAGAVVVFL